MMELIVTLRKEIENVAEAELALSLLKQRLANFPDVKLTAQTNEILEVQ